MEKRELINSIQQLNPTAKPEFLANFSTEDLLAYLHQLQELERDRRRSGQPAMALSA